MKKRIDPKDLKLGMYVVLPIGWFNHPFLKNEFVLRSPEQIQKIIQYNPRQIFIDPDKGEVIEEIGLEEASSVSSSEERQEVSDLQANSAGELPKTWTPETLVPSQLKEAIQDKNLPSQEKAKIVYESSLILMERLLQDPKSENIGEAKKNISEVVDLIVSDDATSKELLNITSYDYYTYAHSINVGVLSVMLAKHLFIKSNAHDMHELGAGFFLHDIGKVRIDPTILNKPGRFTEEEMGIMRKHPMEGYRLLRDTKQLSEETRVIILQHHERHDGTGYPNGLKKSDIHVYARICCIADVFDALTADRPYKTAMTPFESLQLMREQMLGHFQKEMFEKFVLLFAG